MSTKHKPPLSERLKRLADDMYKDECFVAPDEWEVDEVTYLLRLAASVLSMHEKKENGNVG